MEVRLDEQMPPSTGGVKNHSSFLLLLSPTFPHLPHTGPPVILIPPMDTILNMSHNALLRCQAEADPPNMTYVWMRDEENVYHIEYVSMVTLRHKHQLQHLHQPEVLFPHIISDLCVLSDL